MSCGFRNFIEVCDRESVPLGPDGAVTLTMYEAFAPSVFVENAEVPNIIDSSIVVSSEEGVIFNANDNVPNARVCEEIRQRHNEIAIAMLPYSGVGPYHSSYSNLTPEEKLDAAKAKATKYLSRLVENARVLCPRLVVPCAGQMILGGRNAFKNQTLGTPDVSEAHESLTKSGFQSRLLFEGDVLSFPSGDIEIASRPAPPDRNEYIEKIGQCRYWWQDAFQIPRHELVELLPLLQIARERMWRYQERFGFSSDWSVGVTLLESFGSTYAFSLAKCGKVEKIRTGEFIAEDKILQVIIPYNYLLAILTRHCHWNNAYHGCLVDWFRQPDDYIPDIQVLLSYFHL